MAQWRPLHRRITQSDKAYELANDPGALWLYCALLPHTDKEGRVNANPHHILGGILEGWPYTPEQIERWLLELARVGLIELYRNGRRSHIAQFTKFQEMAKPDKREPASDLPGPTDEGSQSMLPEPPRPPARDSSRNLRGDSAKNPREPQEGSQEEPGEGDAETPRTHVHVHVHEQVHVQETRAREARAGALEKPPPEKTRKAGRSSKARSPAFDPLTVDLPDFVSRDVWQDFCEHRKAMRRPLTPQAVKGILTDLGKTPLNADAMLRQTITRGWTGVFPIDGDKRSSKSNGKSGSSVLDQYREKGL